MNCGGHGLARARVQPTVSERRSVQSQRQLVILYFDWFEQKSKFSLPVMGATSQISGDKPATLCFNSGVGNGQSVQGEPDLSILTDLPEALTKGPVASGNIR